MPEVSPDKGHGVAFQTGLTTWLEHTISWHNQAPILYQKSALKRLAEKIPKLNPRHYFMDLNLSVNGISNVPSSENTLNANASSESGKKGEPVIQFNSGGIPGTAYLIPLTDISVHTSPHLRNKRLDVITS